MNSDIIPILNGVRRPEWVLPIYEREDVFQFCSRPEIAVELRRSEMIANDGQYVMRTSFLPLINHLLDEEVADQEIAKSAYAWVGPRKIGRTNSDRWRSAYGGYAVAREKCGVWHVRIVAGWVRCPSDGYPMPVVEPFGLQEEDLFSLSPVALVYPIFYCPRPDFFDRDDVQRYKLGLREEPLLFNVWYALRDVYAECGLTDAVRWANTAGFLAEQMIRDGREFAVVPR